jgi:HEAT repeat protein
MKTMLVAFLMSVSLIASVAQAPPTIEELLQSHHIAISSKSLKQALRSSDPVVRGLAASEIAERGDHSEIPALRQALHIERDDNARLNFSRALNHLGDPSGRVGFEDACADKRMRPDLRLIAADEVSPDLAEACFSALADIIYSSVNTAISRAALNSLKRVKPTETVLKQDRELLANALSRALGDNESGIRQEASKNIAIYKVGSVRKALVAASEKEKDPSTKAMMEDTLHSLGR